MSKTDFKDLIFYEIYPTSFYDSNNDGIGDLKGIEEKLSYVNELGCNAIWLNPFYKSPFFDGGYDVEDFFDVDPRFGTLLDFKNLLKKAHDLNIKVIVDLVIGHASFRNKDFLKSAEAKSNDKTDLFIWTNSVWEQNSDLHLLSGMYPRNGCFIVNFFAHQPAFNYGFNQIDRPWQMSYKDKRTFKAREFMLDVMRFWLKLGVDGFRVDMADSLVKKDPCQVATIEVWRYLFDIIRKEYPNAYFVSEWSNPKLSFKAGFDADFVLDDWNFFFHQMTRSNVNTKGVSLLNGGGDINYIVHDMKWRFDQAKEKGGYIALISGNHDTPRISDSLDIDRLKMYYLFMFSMPGTPFIYYGDEIAMKTMPLDSKDGGYQRTGVRIPMIWNNKEMNHGFSKTIGELYLPFYNLNETSVEGSLLDKNSLYHFIKEMIDIRKNYKDITSDDYEISNVGKVIVIKRNKMTIYLNCSNEEFLIEGTLIKSTKEINGNKLPPFVAAITR